MKKILSRILPCSSRKPWGGYEDVAALYLQLQTEANSPDDYIRRLLAALHAMREEKPVDPALRVALSTHLRRDDTTESWRNLLVAVLLEGFSGPAAALAVERLKDIEPEEVLQRIRLRAE